jgi:hypothetical protein
MKTENPSPQKHREKIKSKKNQGDRRKLCLFPLFSVPQAVGFRGRDGVFFDEGQVS